MGDDVRLRGIYGKPLLKRDAPNMARMTPDMLKKAAVIFLDSVKKEIMKDMAKTAGLRGRGKPVAIPDSRAFVDSFSYKISGQSTIEIISSWPTARAHIQVPGSNDKNVTDPYPMTWLVQPKVKVVPLVTQEGRVIFRAAPLTTADAWIHPGFLRYTFIERGITKGRVRVMEELAEDIVSLYLSQGSLF